MRERERERERERDAAARTLPRDLLGILVPVPVSILVEEKGLACAPGLE